MMTTVDYSDYYDNGIDAEPCDYHTHTIHFLPVIYFLFFVVGVLGNTLVLLVLLKGAEIKSETDVSLLNLAISDLLLLLSLPFRKLQTLHNSKKMTIHLVIAVMLVFFCCWTPYNIAALLKALELKHILPPACESSKSIQLMLQVTEAMAYSHSCINPFLYVFVGKKFRRHLARLLRQTPCVHVQCLKSYMTQVSVYSQATSVEERSVSV